jgi:hypothetical protein
MRQFNEKPSSVPNIGEDITGAARHHRDTYETPEELRKKAFKKASSKNIKLLKLEYIEKLKLALNESTERAQDVLKEYEFKNAILSNELFSEHTIIINDIYSLKSIVLAETDRVKRELLRKTFNRLVSKQRKIRYIRPIELSKYFEAKSRDSFREVNGREVSWSTNSEKFDVEFLKNNVKSVQYGNSLTDNERVYVSEKLVESIKILQGYFELDFLKGLGFSYGARGKAGSIAHYQDSAKVLAFNRGWDGAFIHELGHAIDYHLGLMSNNLPRNLRNAYSEKIKKNEILWAKREYYLKPKEIFARLFEAWVYKYMPERTEYMIFLNESTCIPDLDNEALEFINDCLKPILKKAV